jgi:1-pyrroline-5-carboxylate dehydrogenase
VLGDFALATAEDVDSRHGRRQRRVSGVACAAGAERARLVRKVGDLMEERVYDIAAALTLEVGKNRMEALGEAQETVDFFHHYADDYEQHAGYEHALPNDPLEGMVSRNRSVMRRMASGW